MKKLILFLFISNFVFAQTAVLDTNSILIGEQINFTITNTVNKTEVWPTYEEFLVEGVEIIKEGKLDTTENLISQNFIITAWDSGSYYVPPISFSANSKTEGLLLTVQTIILEEGAELKDIKQPMEAPIGWSDIWPFLVGFLILTLIIYLLKKYVFGEKQNNIKIVPKMIISADVVALKELEKLEKAKIWQSGEVKLYYVNISEIMRRYISERYKFIALELPTDEILQNLRNKNLKKEDLITLTTILQRADLAKYAKSKPTDKENEDSLEFGQDFVNNTKNNKSSNSNNTNHIPEINKKIKRGSEHLNVRRKFLKNKIMSDNKSFISTDYDEFNENTTTKHSRALTWGVWDHQLVNRYNDICLRHVKTRGVDALCLDFSVNSRNWVFLRDGKLTLNCDQENINLSFHESSSKTEHFGNELYCFEYGFYQFPNPKKDLEKVCNANVVKIRISGSGSYEEPNKKVCQAFQAYCQQFYNNFYDNTKYTDALNKKVGKSASGCFIATATMGNYNHPKVLQLRSFRDAYLLKSNWGRIFIQLYYKWGPYPANVIKKSNGLKLLSYYTVVNPLSFIASILIKKNDEK